MKTNFEALPAVAAGVCRNVVPRPALQSARRQSRISNPSAAGQGWNRIMEFYEPNNYNYAKDNNSRSRSPGYGIFFYCLDCADCKQLYH